MADFKGRKRGKSHVQNMGIFLVAQDMVLSHRAKFQLIINFFRVCMYFVVFLPDYYVPLFHNSWQPCYSQSRAKNFGWKRNEIRVKTVFDLHNKWECKTVLTWPKRNQLILAKSYISLLNLNEKTLQYGRNGAKFGRRPCFGLHPAMQTWTRTRKNNFSKLELLKIDRPFNPAQGRTQGRGFKGSNPPIDLSTKMHNKENITFLALLRLFFCNDTDSNMI